MNKFYKFITAVTLFTFMAFNSKAQLAGTYSVPANFPTIAAAITSLNIGGVTGPVTILVDAGYTETAPVGGYTLTATGTIANPIIFQKNGGGANPLITAYTGGTGTPGTAFQDGVWRLVGSDYITIDGIDINDPNVANPATMEFGYGLFKGSVIDGCQNNTIKNCVITLNRLNNATGTAPATDGSRGIECVNATTGAHTTVLTITATTGANSNNRFYSNTIQNCNIGISLIGFADPASPFTNADTGNDIGGASSTTGNTIINYGGGAGATNPAAGVRTLAQYNLNVSFNTINNNTGAGVNHVTTLRGILLGNATSANITVSSNTLTVRSGATTSALTAIENTSGSTAANNASNINNNLITNCTYATATSGVFTGIINSASSATLNANNNLFISNSTGATSGTHFLISNSGAVTSAININSTTVNGFTLTSVSAGTVSYIANSGGTSATGLSISSNSFQALSHSLASSTGHYLIRNSSATLSQTLNNNIFNNLSINTTGNMFFMSNDVALPAGGFVNANNNAILTGFNKLGAGGTVSLYHTTGGPSSVAGTTKSEQNNNFSNITLTGATTMNGWTDLEGATGGGSTKTIANNTFTNWVCGSNAVTVIQTNWNGINTSISSNTITGITGSGAITGYNRGVSGGGVGLETISNNIITNLNSITTGGAVNGISGGSSNTSTFSILNNTIGSFSSVGASVVNGINLSSSPNINVIKNKIYDLQSNNASGTVNGININSGTNSNITNNLIGDLRTPLANATNPLNGINIAGGTNSSIFYNTIHLNSTSAGANFGSSAIMASTTPNINLRNNIFINLSTPTGTGLTVAYRRSSTTLTTYSASSNNNLFYAGTPGASNLIFYDGTNSLQNMAAYQPFVAPRDAGSITENTTFLSLVGPNANFLHVDPTSLSLTESAAINLTGITDDYDNNIRQGNIGYVGAGTAPDVGADEFETIYPPCNTVTAAIISPTAITKCVGQTQAFNASSVTVGSGIVHQWQVGTTPGGPYNNIIGANSTAYTTPTLAAGVYYYVMMTTCTISMQSAVSNEATLTVVAYPVVSVSPVNSTICVPGGSSVTLTGSGANSYTWGPAAGLSGTTGAVVDALPASTTVYTVSGANLAGCVATATTVVNISVKPTLSSVAATSTLVCPGGSSSLTAVGSLTNYAMSSIPYSLVPTPSVGVTDLAVGGLPVLPNTNGDLDDGDWENLPIPFTFSLFGTSYSSFAVSSNGFMVLQGGLPNTYTGYGNAFPSTFAGRPSIAAIYGDLDFSFSGTINTFTTGTAPNRKLIVNWSNGKYWTGGGTGTITSQAVLYETSNIVEVHLTTNSGNANAIEGIQNAAGTIAYTAPGRNSQIYVVNTPDGYRWTPGSVTYSWNPGTFLNATNIPNPIASNFTATTLYSVDVIGNNGCLTTGSINITADIGPTVSIAGGTVPVCNGSTVNLAASGADTYSWSQGPVTPSIAVTPSVTTAYTVVGTSTLNGCTASAVQNVTINPTPTVVVTGSNAICIGQSVTLVATGAQNYTWTPTGSNFAIIAPSPTTTTNYSVVATSSAGCVGNGVKTVTVYALPGVTVSAAPSNTICEGEAVNLIASGVGADTYSWNTGATTPITSASPTVNTSYTVTVGNNFTGCSNSSVLNIVLRTCVGIAENSGNIEGLSIYPNPNVGEFTVQLDNSSEKTIELSDVTGRIILTDKTVKDKLTVNMNEFANGIYYVKIQSNNAIEVVKIIKQ